MLKIKGQRQTGKRQAMYMLFEEEIIDIDNYNIDIEEAEKVGDDIKGIPPIPKDGKESKPETKISKKKGKKEEESLF